MFFLTRLQDVLHLVTELMVMKTDILFYILFYIFNLRWGISVYFLTRCRDVFKPDVFDETW